jgi:hypothetical protein
MMFPVNHGEQIRDFRVLLLIFAVNHGRGISAKADETDTFHAHVMESIRFMVMGICNIGFLDRRRGHFLLLVNRQMKKNAMFFTAIQKRHGPRTGRFGVAYSYCWSTRETVSRSWGTGRYWAELIGQFRSSSWASGRTETE